MSVMQSTLFSDVEKGEFVNSSGRAGKDSGIPEAKTSAALKSHREAERRRRDRINAHLATLRGFVPSNEKMDKAALLAEVINQVRHLKNATAQASQGLHLPTETNEVRVEAVEGEEAGDGAFLLRASLCCEYVPDLLSELRQAIHSLSAQLHPIKSEISIIGGRIKTVFFLSIVEKGNANTEKARELVACTVHSTLTSILDKVSASAEYAQPLIFPQKRQRFSGLSSSCSSS